MRTVHLALWAVLLAGCGPGASPEAGYAADDLGGMGVPQQFASEEFPGVRRSVQVRHHVADNGCFLGELQDPTTPGRHLVVWPAGTEQGTSGDLLALPDGAVVADGDLLSGQGLLMPVGRLNGFGGDSYWDFAIGFCTPGASKVLVLDTVARS